MVANFPKINEIPEEFKLKKTYEQYEYLVNGEIVEWKGEVQEVLSPIFVETDGKLEQVKMGFYPKLSKEEALKALEAAEKAYDFGRGLWPTMRVKDRIEAMYRFVKRMKEKRDEMVNILMWEIGKSVGDSQKEFDRTIDYIVDTIEELKKMDRDSSKLRIEQGIYAQIRRSPLGVVLCLGPYNYPLNELFTTVIPALLMGNAVIYKPAKHGVLLHRPLLEIFKDCFPKGVVNVIYGDGKETAGSIMETGKVDVLAFIGSSRVARILKNAHPRLNRLRAVLSLEAKNPAIILPDADIDQAVDECVLGSLSYNGQRCTALKIIFVHKKIAKEFNEKLVQKIEQLKIGMPWDKSVMITPLPEENKTEYLHSLIEEAVSKGAKVLNKDGGKSSQTLMTPAILFPVNSSMRVYHEEQFGPVIPVLSFDNINEPLKYLVDGNYGQQCSVFGTDSQEIAELIDPLVNQVCRVNINSQCQRGPDVYPFNGRKDSAEGTLSVYDALRVFSIRSMVATKGLEMNKQIITEILEERKSHFLSTDFIL